MERRYEKESGIGLRRRRDGASFTRIVSSGELCEGGSASAMSTSGRRGAKRLTRWVASRPVAIFLAQALLCFIGVVVIPTRLAFELLVQPCNDRQARSPQNASPSAIFGSPNKEGMSVTIPAPQAASASLAMPLVEEEIEWSRQAHGDMVPSVLVSRGDQKRRTGARVLMQAGEGDTGESYTYRTKTLFFFCVLSEDLFEEEALVASLVDVLALEEAQLEPDVGSLEKRDTVEFCAIDEGEEWAVEIGNEASASESAAAISADQMETVRSSGFTELMADALNEYKEDTLESVNAANLGYASLGYVVVYDEDQVAETRSSSGLGSDFHDVLGPDQWWPWWAWLLFGLGFLCCICPFAACIYYFRPGHSGPPSPSGAGGGSGMFAKEGGTGKGGFKDGMEGDLNMKEFEKNGGYLEGDESAYNDADTGVSTDSPSEFVNPMSDSVYPASGEVNTASGDVMHRQVQGSVPEALMATGVAGAKYSSQGGTTIPDPESSPALADESATILSEADRAAGVDPTRQHEQDALDSRGNLVPTISAASATMSVLSLPTGDSSSSFNSSAHGSPGGGGSGGESRPAKPSGGTWQRPSGRSLNAAAAAFGHDESGSEAGDSEFNVDAGSNLCGVGSSMSAAQSAFSAVGAAYLAAEEDDSSVGDSSEQGTRADRDALYEAEVAAAGSLVAGVEAVKSAEPGGAAVSTSGSGAQQSSLPPSGRDPSAGSSRQESYDPVPVAGVKGATGERSRTASHGSGDLREELRELTDEERQVRMQESDAAREASLLRGSSFRVPLQPDLAHAITEEEQSRRRVAVQAVESRRGPLPSTAPAEDRTALPADEIGPSPAGMSAISPPSTATSVVGKVLTGMGRFFGIAQDDTARSPNSAAAAAAAAGGDDNPEQGEGGERGAAAAQMAPLADGTEPEDGVAEAATVAAAAAAGAAGVVVARRSAAPNEGEGAEGAGAMDRLQHAGSQEDIPSEAAVAKEASLRGRSLSPEEVQAYSDKVDQTLEVLPDEGGETMPMSELLARAELDEHRAQSEGPKVAPSAAPSATAAAAAAAAASVVPAPTRDVGLPPPGPGQAAAFALQQQSAAGSNAPSLDLARLIHNAEEGGMTLDELEASLASPIVATPPALLRPGVGAAHRGASARGRGLLANRPSVSGSFVSSRSTSITEDILSNNALTEDDMSSSGQATDVSRTSSYLAAGSSFEESLAQAQAASGHFLHPHGLNPGGNLSSLAEQLARAEETVGRDHEKGLLYRQGPEGVAAAVAGEELPLPPRAAAVAAASASASGGPKGADGGGGGTVGGKEEKVEKVESLADILAKANDGPGNFKETFRRLDDMEAQRLQDLNAAASAEGDDDEMKARWRGSLAELMDKVDRKGNLREVLEISSDEQEESASEAAFGQPSARSDSTTSSAAQWGITVNEEARPE